jgi:hypothetical protein
MPNLQIAVVQDDNSIHWQGHPLGQPGDPGAVELGQLPVNEAVNADEGTFEMGGAEWSCCVGGVEYQVLVGVIKDTRKLIFIGVPSGVVK